MTLNDLRDGFDIKGDRIIRLELLKANPDEGEDVIEITTEETPEN